MYVILTSKPGKFRTEAVEGVKPLEAYDYLFYGDKKAHFVIAELQKAPSCNRAMKIFEACEYGASGDVQFGEVVEKKCEADFLSGLGASQKKLYAGQLKRCDHKYDNESGTMYRSFTAFCRAIVAQCFSQKALKAGPKAR